MNIGFVDAKAAEAARVDFKDSDLARQYPAIAHGWRRAGNDVVPFLDYTGTPQLTVIAPTIIAATFDHKQKKGVMLARPDGTVSAEAGRANRSW